MQARAAATATPAFHKKAGHGVLGMDSVMAMPYQKAVAGGKAHLGVLRPEPQLTVQLHSWSLNYQIIFGSLTAMGLLFLFSLINGFGCSLAEFNHSQTGHCLHLFLAQLIPQAAHSHFGVVSEPTLKFGLPERATAPQPP